MDEDAFPIFANPTSAASKAKGVGVGLNWHFTRQMKIARELRAHHVRGRRGRRRRPSEDFVVTRFQTPSDSDPSEAG